MARPLSRPAWTLAAVALAVPLTLGDMAAEADQPVVGSGTLAAADEGLVEAIALELRSVGTPDGRWQAEAQGLSLSLLEAGLAELEGVLPRVGEGAVSPGLSESLSPTLTWTASVAIEGDARADLAVRVDLCGPEGACTRHAGVGALGELESAIARVVQGMSVALERAPTGRITASRVSDDRYAALVTGRAAAVRLGLMSPPAASVRGDKRRDPIARAAFLDSHQALPWWELGRQATSDRARLRAFERALRWQPESTLHTADAAAGLEAAGRCDEAWAAWAGIRARAPRDPRFVVAQARSALCAGDVDAATQVVELLGRNHDDNPAVVRLSVALADARGPDQGYDALLERWAAVDPTEPEPVRRAIRRRVAEGDHRAALALVPELEARGEGTEARRLAVALQANVSDWTAAERDARALGMHTTAARIETLRAVTAPSTLTLVLPDSDDPWVQVALGTRELELGRVDAALARARQVLADDPWEPAALDLLARAQRAAGDAAAADDTLARLAYADPGWMTR